MLSLKEKIEKKALEIGFDKVGFARAQRLEKEEERLREWLAAGYHAEMKWMEREPEKRANPIVLFPEAKTVVAVALNYFTPFEHSEDVSKGKVSRYAWGDDYHDVMAEKLRSLLAFIKAEEPRAEGKICCDIQPTTDKAWAARAGIGWIGKHSNLITKELGSWVFLGEIFLNLELGFEETFVPDHCGSCSACLDACPTQAIVEPYVVDSKRCLSYATIELRAPELPSEIRKDLSGWLYGCDICQEVCPWNRFERETDEKRFYPRENNVSPDLARILSLSREEYVEKFRGSAMKRTKLSGLRRNARALAENAEILEKNEDVFGKD